MISTSVPFVIPVNRVVRRKAGLQNLLCLCVVRPAKPLRVAVNRDLLFAWFVADTTSARALASHLVSFQGCVRSDFLIFEPFQDVCVVCAVCVASYYCCGSEQCSGAVVDLNCDLDVLEDTRVNDRGFDILSEQ